MKAAISFRVFEYQAVAIARFLAGRATLPSIAEQKEWETKRIANKGATNSFHEIKPDFEEYFNYLRTMAGQSAEGTKGYELPAWDEKWAELGPAIMVLKAQYSKSLKREADSEKMKLKT